MSPFSLALLGLRRRPAAPLVLLLALTLLFTVAGLLLRAADVQERAFHRVDPAVDAIIGPKGNALRLLEGSLHMGRYHHDYVRGLTAMETIEAGDAPPRHVMPFARFGHVPRSGAGIAQEGLSATAAALSSGGRPVATLPHDAVPVAGVTEAFFRRPSGVSAPELADGRAPAATGEIVLGSHAARVLGVGVGATVQVHADYRHEGAPVRRAEATVVGVLAPTGTAWDHAGFTTIAEARLTYREVVRHLGGRQYYEDLMTHLLVVLDPGRPEQHRWLFDTFQTRRAEVVIHVEDILSEVRELTRAASSSLLGALVLLIAALMMALLLRARGEAGRQERALLHALGYGPGARLAIVLAETLAVTALALLCAAAVEQLVEGWVLREIPFAHLGSAVTPGHVVMWVLALPVSAGLAVMLAGGTPVAASRT